MCEAEGCWSIPGKGKTESKGKDIIISGSVASTRQGNEQGVNISKSSGFIKEGG